MDKYDRPTRLSCFVFFSFLLAFGTGCQKGKTQKKDDGKPKATMVQQLENIANINDKKFWFNSLARAQEFDKRLVAETRTPARISLLFNGAIEWLNAGDHERSSDMLNELLAEVRDKKVKLPSEQYDMVRELLAMSYLRKGERENCVQNHNSFSCLIPIHKNGQHQIRDGSEQAVVELRKLLEENEYNFQARWLYNIAHMTLGSYPEKVEKHFLIAPDAFESTVPFPRFTEIATELGIGIHDISGSVILDDFNNDHYLDLMVSSYGLNDQLKYFQNDGKGGFEDLTSSAGIEGLFGGLNMVQADFNNDSYVDVYVLRGGWFGEFGAHPNSLLQNNGDGTFTDVTLAAGLHSPHPTQTATWADFDNDGWLDLFVGNESSAVVDAPTQLFLNQGDGTFQEASEAKGAQFNVYAKGCIAGDYNNDGYTDIFVSVMGGDNLLLKNGGPTEGFRFTNVSDKAGTVEPKHSFPCWFFDFDQDGWEDIFVSGFDISQFGTAAKEVAKEYMGVSVDAELPRLYKNNRDGTFSEISSDAGVSKALYTMGCNFGDLNNDGFPDFYAGTGTPDFRAIIPNRMFLNNAGEKFDDVTKAGGFGHIQKGHGVAFGDIDNDGDQDIYHVLGGAFVGDDFMNALFINPGMGNNHVKLKLTGTSANRSAIGARVEVRAQNADGQRKSFYSRVNSGATFGGNPLLIELGLSKFEQIESVTVNWPGQADAESFSGVRANGHYVLTQGIEMAKQVDVQKVEFDMPAAVSQ